MSKNNKQFNRQDDRSKVKLYKTHHGWMSSLTHFFKIFSFGNSAKRDSGQLINKDEFNSDELANTASKYGKGAATIAATLGFTAGGAALGNEAHAATTAAADEGSQVVGSTSTSTSTASNSSSEKGSQSNADSQSTSSSSTKESQSGSKSVSSTSNTTSQSNSKSATSKSATQSTASKSTSGSTSKESTSTSAAKTSESEATSSAAKSATLTVEGSNQNTVKLNVQSLKNNSVTAAQLNAVKASLVQENGAVTVNTADEFQQALVNKDTSIINVNSDLDLTGYLYGIDGKLMGVDHNVTVNGNGHTIYLNGGSSNNIYVYDPQGSDVTFTIEDANIYSANNFGAVRMGAGTGHQTLVLDNVNYTGGTLVRSETVGSGTNTVVIKGNVNVNAVSAYNANGQTVKTTFWGDPNDGLGTSQMYIGNGVVVSDGASLNMDGQGLVAYNIQAKNNFNDHQFIVGKNATVNLNGANAANVSLNQSIDAGKDNVVHFENGSNVTMNASNANIVMDNGSSANTTNSLTVDNGAVVNLTITGYSNPHVTDANIISTGNGYYTTNGINNDGNNATQGTTLSKTAITINPGATVTATTYGSASNITTTTNDGTSVNNPAVIGNPTVTIDNPSTVTFNKGTGKTYNFINSGTVKAANTDIEITQNGKTDKSVVFEDSTSKIIKGNANNNTYSAVDVYHSKDTHADGVKANQLIQKVNDTDTSSVVYNGQAKTDSESTSTSTSESQSKSINDSTSKSLSDSASKASESTSKSISTSLSDSTSKSINDSTSKSLSDSASKASDSTSKSISTSLSDSTSKSINDSTSKSLSDSASKASDSTSKSISTSLSD